jgi:hypothetical protein
MQPILPYVDDSDEAKAIVAEWLAHQRESWGDESDDQRGNYTTRLLMARVAACRAQAR